LLATEVRLPPLVVILDSICPFIARRLLTGQEHRDRGEFSIPSESEVPTESIGQEIIVSNYIAEMN
jgi:hypothetical protein